MTIYQESFRPTQQSGDTQKRKGQHWPAKIFFLVLLVMLALAGCWQLQNSTATSTQYICRNSTNGDLTLSSTRNCLNGDVLTTADLQGNQGATGLAGSDGTDGVNGLNGINGRNGHDGVNGTNGANGTSINLLGNYQTWSELNFYQPLGDAGDTYIVDGHLATWNADTTSWLDVGHIQGPQGLQGVQGEQGVQGVQGEQGVQGVAGEQGVAGVQGPQGVQGETGLRGLTGAMGPQGLQGVQGETGAQGIQGIQGIQGETGVQGPQGIAGEKGDAGTSVTILGSYATELELTTAHPTGTAGDGYLINGDLFVWSDTENAWLNVGHIQGPQGEQGIQGVAGPQGIQGVTGAQGPQGPQGVAGPAGLQGLQGIQGEVGPQGPQGIQGVQGEVGPQGPQGIQGVAGPQGEQGIQGIQGIQGEVGPQGEQGIQGLPGASGLGSYGSFYDMLTQTNVGLGNGNAVLMRSTDLSSGVRIDNQSQIAIDNAGVYNIAFSAQIMKVNGSSQDIVIWLREDGVDIGWTATRVTIQGNTQRLVAAWNFFVRTDGTHYYQLMWASAEPSVSLLAADPIPANGTLPAIPGIPSIILTVNQVG